MRAGDSRLDGVLAVVEHATSLAGFSRGGGDDFEYGTAGVNGAILGRWHVVCKRLPGGVGGWAV